MSKLAKKSRRSVIEIVDHAHGMVIKSATVQARALAEDGYRRIFAEAFPRLCRIGMAEAVNCQYTIAEGEEIDLIRQAPTHRYPVTLPAEDLPYQELQSIC